MCSRPFLSVGKILPVILLEEEREKVLLLSRRISEAKISYLMVIFRFPFALVVVNLIKSVLTCIHTLCRKIRWGEERRGGNRWTWNNVWAVECSVSGQQFWHGFLFCYFPFNLTLCLLYCGVVIYLYIFFRTRTQALTSQTSCYAS